MFSERFIANLKMNLFAFTKVPLIWFCRPSIIHIDDNCIKVRIPLKRRNKNHLNSMYFGALAVGADLSGAFLAFHKVEKLGKKVSLAFKSVEGEFLKRPESDVIFTCTDGELIDSMLQESLQSGERINQLVTIVATCPKRHEDEPMAVFKLTLSVKVKG